jgi:CheY-like chemotaxis protein
VEPHGLFFAPFEPKTVKSAGLAEAVTQIGPREAAKVLIVDDDFALRDALCAALEGEGLAVAAVSNGQEALDYLRSGARPSLVLLDLMMPIMNGWEFRAQQRQDPELSDIPVVVLSAFARSGDEELRGIGQFLRKPFQLADLLAAVRAYC